MKNFVKTMIVALVLMCGAATAQAQEEGQNAIGVNFGYGVGGNDFSNLGIGIKYAYGLSDNLRAELSGMYYFPAEKNQTDWFDVNLNAHYLFGVAENTFIYPIFGFSTMFGDTSFKYSEIKDIPSFIENPNLNKDSYSDHHFRFGVNLGFGGQYNITEDFGVTLEAKYKLIKDFGHFNIALGCVVLF